MASKSRVRLIVIVALASFLFRMHEPTCFAQKSETVLLTLKTQIRVVKCLAFSPDGKLLGSAGWYGPVKLWDATTGKETLASKGLGAEFSRDCSVAFSPDGKWIASGGWDHNVRLWDPKTGVVSLTLKHPDAIYCLAVSPDGKQVATGSRDKRVRVWDTTTGEKLFTLEGHAIGVHSIAYSADGKRLASGDSDTFVKSWDLGTGKELFTLKQERGGAGAMSLAFSPDGKQLATVSGGTARLWDAKTGKDLLTLKVDTETAEGHNCVTFSPNGKWFVAAGGDFEGKTQQRLRGIITFCDAATGKLTQRLKPNMSDVYSVAFSADGKRLASGDEDGTIIIWDVSDRAK